VPVRPISMTSSNASSDCQNSDFKIDSWPAIHLSARIFVAILCSCLVLAVRNLLLRFPVDHGLELRNKLGDLRGDRHDLIKSFSAHTRRQSRVLAVGTSALNQQSGYQAEYEFPYGKRQ
jgi:hypothetical protein